MARLCYSTAGESHGPALVVVVQGMPAGLRVDTAIINQQLTRRQGGYGRGGRQKIEQDQVRVLSGVLRGITTGSPLAMLIENRDSRLDSTPPIHQPRPGHADLAGAMRYGLTDCRSVVERASARETAARVAAGALARQLLSEFCISCVGYVVQIGSVEWPTALRDDAARTSEQLIDARDASEVYCPDADTSVRMIQAIRNAKEARDTLGGIVETRVTNCPPGLGSCMTWQDKLDGRLMQAVGSIQAVKAVAIGGGFEMAALPGSRVHDAIQLRADHAASKSFGLDRTSNNAGGIEGGMTNGMPVVVRAAMKPISTLPDGLPSVDLRTLTAAKAAYERSDVCAVPAASVVVENVVAFEMAAALVERWGGATLADMHSARAAWQDRMRATLGGSATAL